MELFVLLLGGVVLLSLNSTKKKTGATPGAAAKGAALGISLGNDPTADGQPSPVDLNPSTNGLNADPATNYPSPLATSDDPAVSAASGFGSALSNPGEE